MSNDNQATGHNLDTSEGARAYVAEFFANQVGRHDFRAYITTRLAADFACALAQHLAARQKLGEEPVAWVNGRHLDECIAMPMIESNDDATALNPRNIAASSRPDGYTDTPLYRHPAQAVDLPYSLDADPAGIRAHVCDVITGTLMVGAQGHTPPPAGHWAEPFWKAARADAGAQAVDPQAALLAEERAHGETIDQRDHYHEVADKLARHIAAITGVDIGEHSSANCPWQNAIEAADEYQPAQPVDLGQFRYLAEWVKDGCNFSDCEPVKLDSACRDLLALIDSQAVRNG